MNGVRSTLEEGPAGRQPHQRLVDLHKWFQRLDASSQNQVLKAICEAADAAVFGCLVLLDGLTGGHPVEGQLSDFALYLQIHEDETARQENRPNYRIRVDSHASEYLARRPKLCADCQELLDAARLTLFGE